MAPEWLNLQPPQLLFSYSNRVLSGARNIIEYITSIYFNIKIIYVQALFTHTCHILSVNPDSPCFLLMISAGSLCNCNYIFLNDNSRHHDQTPGKLHLISFLYLGNCLYLDQNVLRKSRNLDAASCRIVTCKIFCINLINLCKIIHILYKYNSLHNLIC